MPVNAPKYKLTTKPAKINNNGDMVLRSDKLITNNKLKLAPSNAIKPLPYSNNCGAKIALKNSPNCAPPLIPRVLSEASGFLITCCNNNAANASPPPASNAMLMRGRV